MIISQVGLEGQTVGLTLCLSPNFHVLQDAGRWEMHARFLLFFKICIQICMFFLILGNFAIFFASIFFSETCSKYLVFVDTVFILLLLPQKSPPEPPPGNEMP